MLRTWDTWLRQVPDLLRPYRVVLFVGGAALTLAVLIILFACFGAEDVRNGAYVFGAAGLIVGLYYTARRIKASEEQVRISEEGHITERFTRAVEQLGNRYMAIRLGGIYALERIARDSPKDHWTVMEVLTAYIRENRPVREGGAADSDNGGAPSKLPTDIQTILSVIGRREQGRESEDQRLDLSNCDLAGADLTNAQFEGAYFIRTRFEDASLVLAHLEGASFWGANLDGAVLDGARVEGTDFFDMNLDRVIGLKQAQLDSAHVDKTNKLPPGLTAPATGDHNQSSM